MAMWHSPRRLWLGTGFLLAALLALGYWLWPASAVPVLLLSAREMVHSIVATATVQTQHRANAGVQTAGKVLAVNVTEGAHFKAGQTLLQLDPHEAKLALNAMNLGVAQANFKMRQWREVQLPSVLANEQQAHANLVLLSAQLARQLDLYHQGFTGQAALEESIRAFRVAEAQASSAQSLRQSHEDQGLEQQLVQSSLDLARTHALEARARLAYTRVLAPFEGLVVSRHVEPGDVVQPGKTLLLLAPFGLTELVAHIDERHLSLLQLGQSAQASADAFPDRRFQAQLMAIAPGVDAQRGSVQVKLLVQNPPLFLRQDMTVSVEIEVGRQSAALAVPLAAVHDAATAQPWVWRVNAASKLVSVPVQLGLRSGSWVQLVTGVEAGQQVLADAGLGMKAGQRVRGLALQTQAP